MNQPEKALAMLDEFMKKDGFPTPKKVIIKGGILIQAPHPKLIKF